ncbi:major facilitator superfamily MFS_1 [Kribbella flavida DSM 17836]|uniref:Major facilitator superfamily MFS_1 n=1 Tax=Kribbella flavida (strain DSM 17836 / JCM 10339 / NBRC 14399) TaxID=479435 RepID=D2PMI0_KRIFD|nr:MFS transporter [Kribbella flavida]ADB30724.1 major facilitator superfamily MFS_1 [Kribbella flavida DSM 17836]
MSQTARPSTSPIEKTSGLGWLAVGAVTAGIFTIVTAELLPVGLLGPIGTDFHVTPGRTGLLMTVPGLVAAVAAPVVTVLTARLDRRVMLCVLIAVLAVANFLAAMATEFWVQLVARVLVGLVIGGFWSIGAGLAARLVPPRSVVRATGVIFSAVPLGSVVGVPAGTLLGESAGWRTAFAVLGLVTVGVLGMLFLVVPPLPAELPTRLRLLVEVLKLRRTRLGLAATSLIVIAHFGTYTYVTTFLREVTGIPAAYGGPLLLVYGVAGFAGNVLAGLGIARNLRGTFVTAASLLAVATALLPLVGRAAVPAVALLVVWGLAYGAIPACSMSWFAEAAPQSREATTVLFTSSFQATLSAGALLGGLVVDHLSVSAVMVCGSVLAATTVLPLTRRTGAARLQEDRP